MVNLNKSCPVIGQNETNITKENTMGYIENNLAKDEKVVAGIKHSWAGLIPTLIRLLVIIGCSIAFFKLEDIVNLITGEGTGETYTELKILYIFSYVLGALTILMGLVYALTNFFEIKSAQLVVTNKRIFGRRGFISKRTTDILISKVDTINVGNGFFGAIFHYGTIEIVSGASGAMTRAERATLKYAFVSNTLEFRKAVLEVIERSKEEERLAQARSLSEAMKVNDQNILTK